MDKISIIIVTPSRMFLSLFRMCYDSCLIFFFLACLYPRTNLAIDGRATDGNVFEWTFERYANIRLLFTR